MKKKGVIALTTLLVISTFLLLGGITLVLTSIDLNKSAKSFNRRTLADLNAKTCFEESLLKLTNDSSYTGNFTVNSTDANCQATISTDAQNSSLKIIAIKSTSGGYTSTINYTVNISVSPPTIIN